MIIKKMNLKPILSHYATSDIGQLKSIDIGKLVTNDDNLLQAKIHYPINSITDVSVDLLVKANNEQDNIILSYNNGTFDEIMIDDILFDVGLSQTDCFVCDKYKLCSAINISDFPTYYNQFLIDGAFICDNCQHKLRDQDIELCGLCHRNVVYDDGYCSDCY